MKYLFTSIILGVTLFISGCANKDMQAKESGFFKNYDKLEKQKNMSIAKAYISPDADFSKYRYIYVAPVKIISAIPKDEQTYKQKLLFTKMEDYITNRYKEVIKDGTNYTLVDTPSKENTLVFESAISAVEVHYDDLSGMDVMPMMFVVKMIKRSGSDANVRILGESRLSDGSTKEVLVNMIELHKGEKVNVEADEIGFKDVKIALDDWMINTKNNLVRLRKGIVKYQGKKDDTSGSKMGMMKCGGMMMGGMNGSSTEHDMSKEKNPEAYKVAKRYCTQCHYLKKKNTYTGSDWNPTLIRMYAYMQEQDYMLPSENEKGMITKYYEVK